MNRGGGESILTAWALFVGRACTLLQHRQCRRMMDVRPPKHPSFLAGSFVSRVHVWLASFSIQPIHQQLEPGLEALHRQHDDKCWKAGT